jgi:hypothetical protein
MTLRRWLLLSCASALVLWCAIPLLFAADSLIPLRFAPDPLSVALYATALIILTLSTRDDALTLFGALWLIWPVVGTYFTIGHYLRRTLWAPLLLSAPDQIFLTNVIALFLGIFAYTSLAGVVRPATQRKPIGMISAAPLLAYPILYASSLAATGGIILSGASVVDSMYSVDRGMIYAFRVVLPLAVAYLFLTLPTLRGTARTLAILFIPAILFISILDGKRDMALIGVLSMLFIAVIDRRVTFRQLISYLLLGLISYAVIGTLRDARSFDLFSPATYMTLAGIEYRDFSHSINYWSPEYIKVLGYDFFRSALAALTNSNILEAFGLSKADMITADSARTWQRAFQSEFGIRIGLIGELHYAFEGRAEPAMFVVGAIATAVRRVISSTSSDLSRIFIVVAFSAMATSLISQSSAVLGYGLTLLYVYLALRLWHYVAVSGPARRSAA